MASTRPIALWGTQVPPGDGLIPLMTDIPATVRITMAAIDPTSEPEGDGPKRATLKIIRRPLDMIDDYDESDEEGDDSEDDGAFDSEDEKSTPKKKKKVEKDADKKMEVDEKGFKAKNDKKDTENGENNDDEDSDDEDSDDEDEAFETEEFVVCTLDAEKHYQQPLDIAIGEEEIVYFKVTGAYDVYLTGNYVHYEPPHDHDDYGEDEEDEDYDLSPSEDELEIFDELDDMASPPRIEELPSDEEEEEPKKPMTKKEKKAAAAAAAAAKSEEQNKAESKKRPAEDEEKSTNGEKLSKKQKKKLKNNEGKAVDASKESESTPSKSDKKVKFAKDIEQAEKPKATKPEEKGSKGSAPRTVNGVTVDDRTVGTGPRAKKGDKVSMRYIGKLLSDGSTFDQNTKGKPFTFTLGKGDVIKGWDFGIVGMQLGGERRLTIPAELAYGKKSLPGIPSNSTLVFDVKLLGLKSK